MSYISRIENLEATINQALIIIKEASEELASLKAEIKKESKIVAVEKDACGVCTEDTAEKSQCCKQYLCLNCKTKVNKCPYCRSDDGFDPEAGQEFAYNPNEDDGGEIDIVDDDDASVAEVESSDDEEEEEDEEEEAEADWAEKNCLDNLFRIMADKFDQLIKDEIVKIGPMGAIQDFKITNTPGGVNHKVRLLNYLILHARESDFYEQLCEHNFTRNKDASPSVGFGIQITSNLLKAYFMGQNFTNNYAQKYPTKFKNNYRLFLMDLENRLNL